MRAIGWWRLRLAAFLLAVLFGGLARPALAAADPTCDITQPDLHFFCASGTGGSPVGYTIADDGNIKMLSAYGSLGGEATLGRVASQRFTWSALPGYYFQFTDRFLLAYRAEPTGDYQHDASLENTLDLTTLPNRPPNTAADAILRNSYGIPPADAWPEDARHDTAWIAAHHMVVFTEVNAPDATVRAKIQAIAPAMRGYFTGQGDYALLGLPTSRIVQTTYHDGQGRPHPAFCLRLQRAGLCWLDDEGQNVVIYGGAALAQMARLLQPDPPDAFQPAPPPGLPDLAMVGMDRTVMLVEPLPGPLAALCNIPFAPVCGQASYAPGARVFVHSLASPTGEDRPRDTSGLELTATLTDRVRNLALYTNRPLPIAPDGTAVLPALPQRDGQYDVVVRLSGSYQQRPVPPVERHAGLAVTWRPAPRLLGMPLLLAVALGLLALMLAIFGAAALLRAFVRARLALRSPQYVITTPDGAFNLALYPQAEMRWTRWLLRRVFLKGADVGAPRLRFGADGAGVPYVAGAGTLNGRLLDWRGSAVAGGARIDLPDGGFVTIGQVAGPVPAAGVGGRAAPIAPVVPPVPRPRTPGTSSALGTPSGRRAGAAASPGASAPAAGAGSGRPSWHQPGGRPGSSR